MEKFYYEGDDITIEETPRGWAISSKEGDGVRLSVVVYSKKDALHLIHSLILMILSLGEGEG